MLQAVSLPLNPSPREEPTCINGASFSAVSEPFQNANLRVQARCASLAGSGQGCGSACARSALHAERTRGPRFPISRKVECLHSAVPTLVGIIGPKLQPLQRLHR